MAKEAVEIHCREADIDVSGEKLKPERGAAQQRARWGDPVALVVGPVGGTTHPARGSASPEIHSSEGEASERRDPMKRLWLASSTKESPTCLQRFTRARRRSRVRAASSLCGFSSYCSSSAS